MTTTIVRGELWDSTQKIKFSLQRYANAESIAQADLNQGRGGRFQNRGIDINRYIVNYCKKITANSDNSHNMS